MQILRRHSRILYRSIFCRGRFRLCPSTLKGETWTLNIFRNRNIEILEWPANSPDINPIEHLWYDLAEMLRRIWTIFPVKLWKSGELYALMLPRSPISQRPTRIKVIDSNFFLHLEFSKIYYFYLRQAIFARLKVYY